MTEASTARLLRSYAEEYETAAFLAGDPAMFMHEVAGAREQETVAFIASCLSYGSRTQFIPKIRRVMTAASGRAYEWIVRGDYEKDFPASDECFYRLDTMRDMNGLFRALRSLLDRYGTLGDYVRASATDGPSAIDALTAFFASHGAPRAVPRDTRSACKRICMFLRWMVRRPSPVDIGLWSAFIDKKTLVMPIDTHVLQQARRLRLTQSNSASMCTALRLTRTMRDVFPDDPLRGDFALFGYGVNH